MAPRVLVVGSGGREHAIVRTLKRSPQQPEILAAPGNPGIAEDARTFADATVADVGAIADLADREDADLTVVGPEAPLVAGLVDELQARGRQAFGPTRAAARLEGSKAFAKEVMASAGVQTANWAEVTTVDEGMEAIDGRYPTVIKFDGLAAGKGVVVAPDAPTARAALTEMIEARRFGDGPVVVEDFLDGEELSLFAICDGERAVPMVPAQDYKRIFDGDARPNTGGMGAYSPVAGAPDADELVLHVHQPVIDLCIIHLGGTRIAGVLLTMDAAQGVSALRLLRPATAIPVHYDDYTVFKSSLDEFRAALSLSSNRLRPDPTRSRSWRSRLHRGCPSWCRSAMAGCSSRRSPSSGARLWAWLPIWPPLPPRA